ncbi:MAG: T9SS type A sorting domain-containing protein [Bacteroidota bacterium]
MKISILCSLLFLFSCNLYGQSYVQNGSFEDNTPSGIDGAYFIDGEVAHWTTNASSSSVISLIQCNPGNPSQQNITASDGEFYALTSAGFSNFNKNRIRNTLGGKIFPGQRLNVSVDHRTTLCSELYMRGQVNLHASGFGNFSFVGNVVLGDFLSFPFGWSTASYTEDVPVLSNSPCFFDEADLINKGELQGENADPKGGKNPQVDALQEPPRILFDNFIITGCTDATDDLLFYNIGTDANCTKVSFTLECDLDDKQWYYWEFGDGNTLCGADEPSPMHEYLAPGEYTVTLTTVNGNGCLEIITESILINCNGCEIDADFSYDCGSCSGVFEFLFDPVTGTWSSILVGQDCSVNFTDESSSSSPIVGWTWTENGAPFSNSQNPSASFFVSPLGGIVEVCLSVIDAEGCVAQKCENIYAPCRGRSQRIDPPAAPEVQVNSPWNDLKIYPNPAQEVINLEWSKSERLGAWSIQLFDLSGKLLRQIENESEDRFANTRIDVSDLSNGTYLLRLVHADEVATKKIVIQR